MKLNDLVDNLKRTLDIQEFFPEKEIQVVEEISKNSTQDIRVNLPDLSLKSSEEIRLHRNNTKNFDALSAWGVFGKLWRKKTLDLTKPQRDFSLKSMHENYINFDFKWFFIWNKLLPVFIVGFFVFAGMFLYLDKLFVENRVNAGYEKVISLQDTGYDIKKIRRTVNNSRLDFMLAHLWFLPFSLIDNSKIKNADAIIKGWKYLTESLDDALFVFKKTENFINKKGIYDIDFTQLLLNLKSEFIVIWNDVDKTISYYEKVANLWNPSIEWSLAKGLVSLREVSYYISLFNNNFDTILSILGHDKEKKYLVVFQNTDEIRPTWWFMWSMWIMTLSKWNVQSFDKKDVYAYEWNLKTALYEKLKAPEGLNKITENFGLRDANYFINTRDSSRSIKFFIEKAGYKIDGIVYVNQNTLLDFLDETGEVDFKKLSLKVSSANFSELFSSLVEAKLFKVGTLGTPKSILFDFIEEFTQKLISDWDYFAYAKILSENIKKREIMVYLFDPKENAFLEEIWLTGNVDYESSLDFAYPSFTSISWNKSDRYILRSYEKEVVKNNNCSIDTNFQIELDHTFSAWDETRVTEIFTQYDIEWDDLLSIQWKWDNYAFIRVMLPPEAEVVQQKDIVNIIEHNRWKTVEFYMKTPASSTTVYNINYALPNKECREYGFTLFKQPWVKNYNLDMQIGNDSIKEIFLDRDYYYAPQK